MPRVLARRPAPPTSAAGADDGDSGAKNEWVEWVEWPDEPRHELLFDVPEPFTVPEDGPRAANESLPPQTPAARAYAAFFQQGGERLTLFHRHRHDTAYVCASAAADEVCDAEVWNEELRALAPDQGGGGSPSPGPAPAASPAGTAAPTHELLAPTRVHHTTGMCFCNPHRTRDGGAYVHRIRYAAGNPRSLHFVGVEVRPPPPPVGSSAAATGSAPLVPPPPPRVAGRHASLKLEYEQPGLFRAWRLVVASATDGGGGGGGPAVTETREPATTAAAATAALGGGFAGRGGAVVLIRPVDWSKVAYDCGGGDASAGPFGEAARRRARGAGGWPGGGAAGGGGGGGGGGRGGGSIVFPAGAAWPLLPEDGRAPFSFAPREEGAVLEVMLVEFL